MRIAFAVLVLLVALEGCTRKPAAREPAEAQAPGTGLRSIEDRDWELVALGGRDHPTGAGGKPATLRLDTAANRAVGNAGCNRYSGAYSLKGDSLAFGPAISTKMFCADGMELESAWLGAMAKVTTWSATDSTLELSGAPGLLARFEERRQP